MEQDKLEAINNVIDMIVMALISLQEISGMSKDEIMNRVKTESEKTDNLIDQLR